MKRLIAFLAVLGCAVCANAQWYNVTFRGVSYAQDSTGNLAPTLLTERTLVEAAAESRGISTNNLTLIYHVESGGDSLKVVDQSNATEIMRYFLFTFGTSLGRTAVTNAAGTEIRGVEYVYTTDTTRYSSWNDHSMGAVVLHRRIMTDSTGQVRESIDGQAMQWCVLPQGSDSAKTCTGSFQTGTLFTPP